MRWALKTILENPDHRLSYLVDRTNGRWLSRAPDDPHFPGIHAGHEVSEHAIRRWGGEERIALQDASFNQLANNRGETQGAIFQNSIIKVDGVPIERRTAEQAERLYSDMVKENAIRVRRGDPPLPVQGLRPGTVASSSKSAGWNSADLGLTPAQELRETVLDVRDIAKDIGRTAVDSAIGTGKGMVGAVTSKGGIAGAIAAAILLGSGIASAATGVVILGGEAIGVGFGFGLALLTGVAAGIRSIRRKAVASWRDLRSKIRQGEDESQRNETPASKEAKEALPGAGAGDGSGEYCPDPRVFAKDICIEYEGSGAPSYMERVRRQCEQLGCYEDRARLEAQARGSYQDHVRSQGVPASGEFESFTEYAAPGSQERRRIQTDRDNSPGGARTGGHQPHDAGRKKKGGLAPPKRSKKTFDPRRPQYGYGLGLPGHGADRARNPFEDFIKSSQSRWDAPISNGGMKSGRRGVGGRVPIAGLGGSTPLPDYTRRPVPNNRKKFFGNKYERFTITRRPVSDPRPPLRNRVIQIDVPKEPPPEAPPKKGAEGGYWA